MLILPGEGHTGKQLQQSGAHWLFFQERLAILHLFDRPCRRAGAARNLAA
ncbi:hypothetical protein [Candidatus Synechococcus spongiarum]|nr:hypothetical protein [Candidatus Synechococcus spongiarum]MCY4360112.1 hypothetical protein [Cyanobacteria bacterium MAG APA_bin_95]